MTQIGHLALFVNELLKQRELRSCVCMGGHPQVSNPCRALLEGLLVPDPHRRLTMEGIKAHPWFLTSLPDGALLMNDFYMRTVPQIEQARLAIPASAVQCVEPEELGLL